MEALRSLMALLSQPSPEVDAFVQANMADCNAERTAIAAILPSHPQWFAKPEPGDAIRHVLVVAKPMMESRTRLPMDVQYLGIRITALDPVMCFEIDTAECVVRTNMQELWALDRFDITEPERLAVFKAFTGRYTPPAPRVKAKAFKTRTLGMLKPDKYGDLWEAAPVNVPFFDGRSLPVQLLSVSAADGAAIDAAMDNFLQLNAHDRTLAAPAVLANCQDFLGLVDLVSDADHVMAALTDPDAIWPYVDCQSIDIVKDDGDGEPAIYIVLTCNCEWEPEHGLQIVYRNGLQLTRVSEQDGHVRD